MAKMSIGDSVEQLKDKPYISLSEPACGAGGMVIATAKHMIESGFNPNTQLLAVCTDIDVVAARMCYVQLSMLGIPAIVNIGNTLSMAINTTLYTPFLYVNYWRFKDFFNPPDNLSYIERGNITDISNHGKYVGRIIELQGRGHSCGKHIHQSFSDAVQALVARKKNLNA
ncbi:hypothetical protein I2494_17945 [Budviciaceae bacterium BWR-B9]|uniref:SAM-dependent DNA methyltransferase n=1 Tax=Limnobaculum allomyrinae TaxID=2791986 RepID=A0ABS1IUX6_9GAMM|nr:MULTISPECIES: SAM-dependent methyltransferase [Limnobaculum]MBK5145565.1 hypothetical protein [Limnobaculum allomyrinae]MBV7693683.1 SAM-dependent methyltransferase [Limnobaculum sp. M2-1]